MTSKSIYLVLCGILLFNISVYNQTRIDDGKKIVMRYFDEVLNKRKLNVLPEVFSGQYLLRNIEDGSSTKGINQLQDFLPHLFKAFPDLKYTINTLVEENGSIALQTTVTGTHRGEIWGLPPSNKKINVVEIFFFKVKDGRIVECSQLLNLNTLKYQLATTGKTIDPISDYLAEKLLLD